MSVRGSSHHRSSDDPVTFGDIPPEAVRKAFVHLSLSDLAIVRLVCRGWNPTGQDVMMSRVRVVNNPSEKFVCGLHLRRLVGFKSFVVKSLELVIRGGENACTIRAALYSAPTLTSLKLDFEASVGVCYNALRDILKHCRGIRHLQLIGFYMGDDIAGQDEDALRDIKDGLSRLNRLDLIRCCGNVLSFIIHADIPNIQSLSYESNYYEDAEDCEDSILAIAAKYPTLTSIRLEAEFDSSDGLLKVMGRCLDLEKLFLLKKYGDLVLSRSDILTLRRLKFLDIECDIENDADSALSSFKSLKSLRVFVWDLSEVLPSIGGNLVSLEVEVSN
jgi:hypothetical protein